MLEAFLSHFRFNMELLPRRDDLEKMSQRHGESISEYTYRWRQAALRLKVQLDEDKLIPTFIKTHSPVYQMFLMGWAKKDFSNLITTEINIKESTRDGTIPGNIS